MHAPAWPKPIPACVGIQTLKMVWWPPFSKAAHGATIKSRATRGHTSLQRSMAPALCIGNATIQILMFANVYAGCKRQLRRAVWLRIHWPREG